MSRRDDRNGRAAIVAILAFGAQLAAAGRAGDAERQAALPAELCLVAIILLASWTLHAWTFSRMGRLLPKTPWTRCTTVVQPENTMQPTAPLHSPAKIFPRGL